jgi:NAD(P)-dependent dehydrogenase (short-subunit alcohol dehydrogenase family)
MQIEVPKMRVLVTGGAAGIGRVIAETFAGAGARVFICDIVDENLKAFAAANPTIATSKTDISDRSAVDRMFEEVARRLGGLDAIVNNASIPGSMASVDKIDPDEWERVCAVNVHGTFYCTRRAIPMIKAAGKGSIVNISSVAGRLPYAMRSPYSTTKWAMEGFTKCLALELGSYKIRANTILPGIVDGERRRGNSKRRAAAAGVSVEDYEKTALARVALGSMVQPQEIAQTALFLASDAGRNITGQSISVCGYVQALTGPIPRDD